MERNCRRCGRPLDPDAHGNQKMHTHCAYEHKKESQKENYLNKLEQERMVLLDQTNYRNDSHGRIWTSNSDNFFKTI